MNQKSYNIHMSCYLPVSYIVDLHLLRGFNTLFQSLKQYTVYFPVF